jgi:hypothetical protein
MADLPLDDATLDRLAEGIAANLDYAFSIAWSPRWVKDDEPHRWTEGSQHFRGMPQVQAHHRSPDIR